MQTLLAVRFSSSSTSLVLAMVWVRLVGPVIVIASRGCCLTRSDLLINRVVGVELVGSVVFGGFVLQQQQETHYKFRHAGRKFVRRARYLLRERAFYSQRPNTDRPPLTRINYAA